MKAFEFGFRKEKTMNILFCTSECYPFLKTGGLGDVASSLPRSLNQKGVDVRVILPYYASIPEHFKNDAQRIAQFNVPVGWRNQYAGLMYLFFEGVHYYFIDNEYYFKRDGSYGYYDDGERFSYFCRAVLESIGHMDFAPDILHLNDWHTGIIPVLNEKHFFDSPKHRNLKFVFTIHNLKFQGVFGKELLEDMLGLDDGYYTEDKLKFHDGISFMKAGIVYSNAVTTVSNTYKYEIQNPYFGEKLDGLLKSIDYKLFGILNGIDYSIYNPETDDGIYQKYSVGEYEKRAVNKDCLQKDLGLYQSREVPIISIITRLTPQKGLDLISCVFEDIMAQGVQFIVLGTGDIGYEDFFRYYQNKYRGSLAVKICFDNNLAKKIYAGSDLFLMPSQFEPCGLSQLMALKYGCLPIVRNTGGLADTINPLNEITMSGNGFSFDNYNAHDMLNVIKYALDVYHNKKDVFHMLMDNAMHSDFSFGRSADQYIEVYHHIL